MDWHLRDSSEVAQSLECDPATGLSSMQAEQRLRTDGRNELMDKGGTAPLVILWEQFTSTMSLILTAAAAVSAIIGSFRDSGAILAIVCLFALLGFFQEYRAERAIRALRRLTVPVVRVRRNGGVAEVSAAELVPGDLVLLETGNLIPADCRLMEAHNLKVQESLLTGESEAVEKCSVALQGEQVTVADRNNMVFMGTTVSSGRGSAIVVATGMATELGRIAAMLQEVVKEWTPLQRRLDRLGKVLALLAVAVAGLFFVGGLLRGEELRLMLMTAVSLAVAAIPEGLPAVVTITLAIGAQRMLGRHALIRKLPAVETLGSVTVICSDKTGTLTENRMTVTGCLAAAGLFGTEGPDDVVVLLTSGVLCNDAVLREDAGQQVVVGDPTEGALLSAGAAQGLFRVDLELMFPRRAEVPFDAATKRMATIHDISAAGADHLLVRYMCGQPGDHLVVAKGASDSLLPFCTSLRTDGEHREIGAKERALIARRVDDYAAAGRRVLLHACRVIRGSVIDLETCLDELTFMGLSVMMDPPRSDAKDAVERCRQAGIRPVMITGDHPLTAASIAEALGLGNSGRVVTGAEIERCGVEGLAALVGDVSIFARVSPEHKLMIVEALKQRGDVVAMTGDGVNDAPALKSADIGVAMGVTGTDVAKESADMVLLDDNFATIVAAVEEGRTIYDNICKFIEFSVAGNLGKILAVVCLPLLGLPLPLTPLQLLWLNLLTDGLLGLGMGVERAEPDIMKRTPIAHDAQIFDRRMLRHTLLTGSVIALMVILVTWRFWHRHPQGAWQTVLFCSLAFVQIGQAMALRSSGHLLFSIGLFSNPLLMAMAASVVVLQLLVVFVPELQPFFATQALTMENLLWTCLPGGVLFTVLELEKLVRRRDA